MEQREQQDQRNQQIVDLVMFMGQSNMAGRGDKSQSDICEHGHGFEFRAISDPTHLYDITEPFGLLENNEASGVVDKKRSGSLVSAFASRYFEAAQVPVVGVSCSKGGTSSNWWQADKLPLQDAVHRLQLAKAYLNDNNYLIRHCFMVWCQGETDGDKKTPLQLYKDNTIRIVDTMCQAGIEKCFLIAIGNYRDSEIYAPYRKAQLELCEEQDNIILASDKFVGLKSQMIDVFHYNQLAYNIVGRDAGTYVGEYYKQMI